MKTTTRFLAAVTFLFFASISILQAQAPATATAKPEPLQIPELKFEKYKLANGLEVILSEDHRLPLVAVNLWYHVGPANETAGRTGFAHLFEHMMFEGSKHVESSAHAHYLEAAGATDFNGTTDFDRTNYYETLPSNQLELALWLESDRMGYLPDKLTQANLSNQQDVVRNERRQSTENVPYGLAQEAVFHELFPKEHPYYPMVIGSHADIQAAKLEDVRNFFKQYYAPNNASLAIVGDFDRAKTKELVEKYFGPLKNGLAVPRVQVTTPPITAERRKTVQDNVQLPRVYMAWLTSPIFKPGDAEADIAASALGGGKSSRLYKKLVYEKQLALDVEAEQQSLVLRSVFQISATARPGVKPEDLEKAINEELAGFQKSGPTADEMKRARNGIETRTISGLEILNGVANLLNSYNHYLGTPDFLAADIGRYENATPEAVQVFSQEQLKTSERVVVYAVPGKPDLGPEVPTPKAEAKGASTATGEAVNADAAWREKPPAPGPARPLVLPVPEEFKLSNGLTVLFTERPGLPLVAASVVLRRGSGANPVDRPGLASFTSRMLQQGTATRTALQIADRAADLGTTVGTRATVDSSRIGSESLTRNFPDVLELMSDMLLHPSFPQKEIDRVKSERQAALVQERDEPFAVATRVYSAALYGPKYTYGYPDIGTSESLKTITREDLEKFWKENYLPSDAAIIVAGNIKRDDLKALLEKQLAGWKGGEAAAVNRGTPERSDAKVIVVDRPDAPQTTLVFFSLGPARSTPDYVPLEVMNADLGGLFSSRINMNLREEHGYTYGAGSFFAYHIAPGPFIAYSDVRTDVTAPAVTEVFKELKRIREAPMSAEELKLAKDSIAQSLPGRFERGAEAAGTFAEIYVYGLPLDYFSQLPGQINAVTAEQAQAAAQKYVQPEQITVLAVGDRAKIEGELKKLNLGKMETRDPDGKLVQ
ncbi:MAG TPA: pitrilysin family protein [Candidatus Saccharimonadales bacterium]|nr:pitrilysin family protein [Candidatus Saccharimonadales bacterium]